MAIIRLHKDPLKQKPEVYHAFGVKLIDWMYDNCRWAHNGCVVKVNGHIVANSLEHDNMAERLSVSVSGDDGVDIYAPPEEAATIIYAVVAIIAAGVAYALTPTPSIAGDAGKRNTSPNAQLNAANNEFRQDQAIPDKAGESIAYPDFLQPSYYVYENNEKIITEHFIVGRDYVGVDEVRSSNTPISEFTVYQPDSTLPTLLNVRGTNEVEGQEIQPPDDTDATVSLNGATVNSPDQIVGFDAAGAEISVGDLVDIDMTWNGGTDTLSGQFEVSAVSGSSGIRLASVSLNQSQSVGDVTGSLTNPSSSSLGQWYTLEGDAITEIRFQVQMPQGIRDENDDVANIIFSLEAEVIDANGDPTGVIISSGANISGKTQDPQFRTFYLDDLNPNRYRARITRTTNSIPAPGIDLVKSEDIQSVTPYTSANFDSATFLRTVRRATTQPTTGSSPKTNVRARNLIPIFDPNTGTFGARAFTRSFAQYAMYLLVTLGGEPLENIDYETLFDIEASLPSAELGYFDFSFDDAEVSLKDRLQSCLNVARCNFYMVGNRYNFVRDEPQDVRIALFNRRNIAPESSAQSFRFLRSDDFDSVELTYVDPVDNVKAYLTRRINRATGAIEVGRGQRVKKMDLGGCRNLAQATDRVNREILRIKYEWYRLKTTVLSEGQSVGVGNRIGWCDILEENLFQGEILGQSDDTFDTSEKFIPEDGVTYYVYIEQDDGTISNSVVATARTDTEFGFVASGLTAFVADGYTAQRGSGYVIAPLSSLNARDFIITSRSKADAEGKVTLEGYTYDERAYPENSTELPTG